MTFERLNLQYDMLYLLRRIEKNMRVGKVEPERVRSWAEATIRAAVPPRMPNAEEYISSMIDHCNRWVEYIANNPVITENTDYLENEKIEQLRIACVFADECKEGGYDHVIKSNRND